MNSNRARLTASVVASVMFLAGGARAESLRFADDDALDGGDGLSWMTAYNDLQDALGDAGDPNAGVTEIRVAGGIYVPSLRMDPNDPRTATFLLLDSVALRGGYAGLGDPNAPNVRNIALHESVLSGDLAGDDGPNFANYQENSYHVVTALGVSPSAVLDGFTVSGGSASDESYPAAYGGGLYCEGASPTVCDCTFKRNMGQFGAAMFNYQSCPTLTRCTLRDNWCIHYGGAICNWQDSSPELTDCLIRDNRAELGGGLCNLEYSSPTLIRCQVFANTADSSGGGLFNSGPCSPTLIACKIIANRSYGTGGGLTNSYYCSPVMVSCLISSNHSDACGGGMINSGPGVPVLTNCTVVWNVGALGGGLKNQADSNPVLTNCILWGNSSAQIYNAETVTTINFSCVYLWNGSLGGVGNFGTNPQFIDPAGPDGQTGTLDDDLSLHASSPCVNAGRYAYFVYTPSTDVKGNCRVVGDQIDMGCCEQGGLPDADGDWLADADEAGFLADPLLADTDGDGLLDGIELLAGTVPSVADPPRDWAVPFHADSIQKGLFFAREGERVVVSPGTYYENLCLGGRAVTLTGTDPSDSQVVAATVVDGGQVGPVLRCLGTEGPDTVLAGLTLTHGLALSGGGVCGGTEYAQTELTISDCVITGNTAQYGGGIAFFGGSVIRCLVTDNMADYDGGGAYVYASSPRMDYCTFVGNRARDGGGLRNAEYSTSLLSHCTFSANEATASGGGVSNDSYSAPQFTNCLFVANRADGGGAIANVFAPMSLTNCVVAANSGDQSAGGLHNMRYGSPILANCIFWGNLTGGVIDEMAQIDVMGATAEVRHCCIQDWTRGGVGNICTVPLFVDPDGADGDAATWQDNDYHLSSESPCINRGDPNGDYTGQIDIDGNDRVAHGCVDMGVDEFTGPLPPARPALVAADAPPNGTLPKTQNNVLLLTFDMPITLTDGDPLSIVELADPNNDVGGLFTYTVDPNDTGDPSGATLKAIQIGGQLANETWYRIAPAAGFDVHLFEVDVCTLTGDADGSGAVTTSDYSVVKMHLGERNDSRYDLNGSGRITTADYGVVKTHMGVGTPTKP